MKEVQVLGYNMCNEDLPHKVDKSYCFPRNSGWDITFKRFLSYAHIEILRI